MLRTGVLLAALAQVLAGYPDGVGQNNLSSGQSYSNSFGYGYSGSLPDGAAAGNIPQFDFQGFLNSYLDSINKYHQEFVKKGVGKYSYSFVSSNANAKSQASSSITYENTNGLQTATAQAAQGAFVPQSGSVPATASAGGFGGSYAAPGPVGSVNFASAGDLGNSNLLNRFAAVGPNGGAAVASASLGPNGVQQTAAVYPESPTSPNVNINLTNGNQPADGFRSVFTSSSSHSTNVNGQTKTVNQASTTVNDNGKVTTYTVKNP